MSDHSGCLRNLIRWYGGATRNAITLAADVLDAIPDKDDPVGWVARIKDWTDAQGSEMSKLVDKFEMQQDDLRDLRALRDAIPGDDKLATVQWAVKIAAAATERHDAAYAVDLDERALAHGVANCHATIDACPPSVRTALRSSGVES